MKNLLLSYPSWDIQDYGYTPITNFWDVFRSAELEIMNFQEQEDLSDLELKMLNKITDLYSGLRKQDCVLNDIKIITELCMVLNHSIYLWYNKNNLIARLYDKLWKELDCYIINNYNEEDLKYFYRTTD